MLEVNPVTAQMARENREFLGRAVGYVAAAACGSSSMSGPACRWC